MSKKIYTLSFFIFFCFFIKAQIVVKPFNDTLTRDSTYQDIDSIGFNSQETKENFKKYEIDTTLLRHQIFIEDDSINIWKSSKDFAYLSRFDTLLQLKMNALKKNKINSKSTSKLNWIELILSSSLLHLILWTIAISFIIFLIFTIFLKEGIFRRYKVSKAKGLSNEVEELDSETDFEKMITAAVNKEDFRLAIRFQYLQAIHKLADNNFIRLAPGKTNFQYVTEITNKELRNNFTKLTLNYEFVWYGKFVIDKIIYQKINSEFKSFNI